MNKLRLKNIIWPMSMLLLIGCGSGEEKPDSPDRSIPEAQNESITVGNTTTEQLGKTFVFALQQDKYELIEQFLPSEDDFKDLLGLYDGTEEEKKEILAGSGQNSKKIKENTALSFEEIKEEGVEAGIIWEEIKFGSTETVLNPENNVDYAEVTVLFSSNNLDYKIFLSECINTSRGWLIFDQPKWLG